MSSPLFKILLRQYMEGIQYFLYTYYMVEIGEVLYMTFHCYSPLHGRYNYIHFTDEKTKMLRSEIIPLIQKIKIQTQVCLILDSIIILIH